jgi:hypothetical protein
MGSHWWDLTSPELNGEPFTHALLFGYYDGQLKFIEPMTTVVFLKSRPALTTSIKQPAAFAEAGLYPESYGIRYSAAFDEYSISLEGLTHRSATAAAQPSRGVSRRKPPAPVPTSEDGWCRAPISSAATFE